MLLFNTGIKIPDVVSQVQENVRRTVEAITGLKVALVNIYVQNIIILKEEDKNEILKNSSHPLISEGVSLC